MRLRFSLYPGFSLFFQTLTVTDDTVLEEHNEDPTLIQMQLIDDGGKYFLHCFIALS